jgi:ABC-type uncharacterized transport system auxiliary subunit
VSIPRALGALATASIFVAALGAQGCLSKAAVPEQTFTIDPPAARAAAPAAGAVLMLDRVQVAPAYSGQSLVYRTGEHGIERDPYAQFAAPPGWLLTSAIRGYLVNADFVRDVVVAGNGLPAAATIEVVASELAGDLKASSPAAILTLQFRVLRFAPSTRVPSAILLKTYTRSTPISERTARAVVSGLNQALGAILAEFEADLKAALSATSPPS